MADPDELAKITEIEISNVLVAEKDPVTVQGLNRAYKHLVFKDIPFRQLGFTSLEDYLFSISRVVEIFRAPDGQVMCRHKPDERTAHVFNMVMKQVRNCE
jgi:hypothetical protein